MNGQNKKTGGFLTVRETAVYPMLAALMFCSKIVMEALPNIHLLGMLIMTYTLVLRKKALIPIYLFVFVSGLYAGFATWWIPYLYIWALLWAAVMLLPRRLKPGVAMVVYPAVCALHGLFYGALYAPVQALITGLSFRGMLAWIAAGLPFDAIHAAGNFAAGLLILPLSGLLERLMKQ